MVAKFGTLILALVLVSGCTRESTSKRTHEGAVASEEVVSTESGAQSLSSPVEKDFAVRFEKRLSLETLENESRRQSPQDRADLYATVNEASKLVAKLEPKDAARARILLAFSKAITAGCDDHLRNCRYLSLFRNQAEATTLVLILADEPGIAIQARYRFLSIAFAISTAAPQTRLLIAYLSTAKEYETELARRDDRESRAALQQHREVIDMSLGQMKAAIQNSSGATAEAALLNELETSFDVWNFDRLRKPENTVRDETVLGIVASKLFGESQVQAQLDKTNTRADSAGVKLAKVPVAARKALGVETALPQNALTLIFENLWLGRMTPTEADILWGAYVTHASTSLNSNLLRVQAQKEMLNYARTRLLTSAKDVNAIMTDFFAAKGKFVNANAFHDGLKEALKGQTMWADSKRRFEVLQRFNDRNLRSADLDVQTAKDLDMFFASIDRNIKMLSTYPSMLVMSYHLARLGFALKVQTWTRVIEINAGQILDWFFEGALDPWMPYGSDIRPLSKSEISTVFFYALEMGILSEGGVDLDNLFKMLTEQMVGPLYKEVERIDDALRVEYEVNPAMTEFNRLCARQEQLASSPIVAAAPTNLLSLKYMTASGLPQGTGSDYYVHPNFGLAWSFFETERQTTRMSLDENLEIVRLELTPKIARLRMLARLTEDYVNRHEREDRAQVVKAIDSRISPLEVLRKRFYTRIFKLAKPIGACGEKLIGNELQTQIHVVRGLTAHFREVHALMKAMRAQSSKALDQRFNFASTNSLPGLAEHESGYGVSADMYRFSQLQALLRIKSLLENGYNDGANQIPAKREKGSIVLPPRLRDIGEVWRSTTLRLDWNEDLDEFVTNGIQQYFDVRNGFVSWASLSSLSISVKYRIRSMSALAKAGPVQTDSGPQSLDPKEVVRMTLAMEKWFEIEDTPWVNVLNVTGQYNRIGYKIMGDDFMWEKGSQTWMSLLKVSFDELTEDKLGQGGSGDTQSPRFARRMGPMAELAAHARIAKTYGRTAGLNISPVATTELTGLYTKTLDAQVAIAATVVSEARRLDPIRAANPKLFPSWRLYASRKAPDIELLSASDVEMYRSKIMEFGRQNDYVVPEDARKILSRP